MTSFTIMYIILGLSLIREIKASNMWPPCMEGYVEINGDGDGDGASSCVEIDDGSDNNLWRKFLTLYEPFYRDDDGDGGGTSTTDEMVRIELLNTSAQFISKHNNNVLNENSSYTLGLTPYRYVKQS
ncbi:MAG: hypothetical protein ACI8RD_012318 [Bacillariaceae sp.]|jgi:hypothetical protein